MSSLNVSAECRDLRHAWFQDGDTVLTRRKGQVKTFERTIVCQRCGTSKVEQYRVTKRTVERESVRYTYADGYMLHGAERVTVADVRRWIFTRSSDAQD